MTNIQGIAASDELNSPFYLRNKSICDSWEDYLSKSTEKINGKYSAWAMKIKATVLQNELVYKFDIEKSTMTNPSLLFKILNEKDVHEITKIEVNNLNHFDSSFVIRRKRKRDLIWRKWTSKYHLLKRKLITIKPSIEDESFQKLLERVDDLEIGSNLDFIKYNKSKSVLQIKFRSVVPDVEFLNYILRWNNFV